MKTAAFLAAAAAAAALTLNFPAAAQDLEKIQDVQQSGSVEKAKSVAQDLIFRSVELENRVRIRETTNRLRQTPEIAAILDRIAQGSTDEEIRLARIDYYRALDKGLKAALPDLKERISERTREALSRLEFNNVRSHEEVAAGL